MTTTKVVFEALKSASARFDAISEAIDGIAEELKRNASGVSETIISDASEQYIANQQKLISGVDEAKGELKKLSKNLELDYDAYVKAEQEAEQLAASAGDYGNGF